MAFGVSTQLASCSIHCKLSSICLPLLSCPNKTVAVPTHSSASLSTSRCRLEALHYTEFEIGFGAFRSSSVDLTCGNQRSISTVSLWSLSPSVLPAVLTTPGFRLCRFDYYSGGLYFLCLFLGNDGLTIVLSLYTSAMFPFPLFESPPVEDPACEILIGPDPLGEGLY